MEHLTQYRAGFDWGFTPITQDNEAKHNTGINLGILKLKAGNCLKQDTSQETAFLLLNGQTTLAVNNESIEFSRDCIFKQNPSCVHVCQGNSIQIAAHTDLEILITSVKNTNSFPTSLYKPNDIRTENRGKGQVNDTCHRMVRTIFDDSNSHNNTELVIGEVINFPGKWSSYPPHHHTQPEIYHYRFDKPNGFGHAELDDRVFKVKNFDSIKILDQQDHAQCSAPGYAMYYTWIIRHLPDDRYTIPTFTEAHKWILSS